jgi:hypothetical protein
MLEKDLENIIIKYPDLIEEGLTYKGNQVYVDGKHRYFYDDRETCIRAVYHFQKTGEIM